MFLVWASKNTFFAFELAAEGVGLAYFLVPEVKNKMALHPMYRNELDWQLKCITVLAGELWHHHI